MEENIIKYTTRTKGEAGAKGEQGRRNQEERRNEELEGIGRDRKEADWDQSFQPIITAESTAIAAV